MEQINIREKHPLPIRICHWLNVIFLSMMIWSGVLIAWAEPAYVPIPESIGTFQIHHRLAQGMAWHFFIMWFFVVNGIFYVSYLFFSGEWKNLLPGKKTFREAFLFTLYDLGLSQNSPQWKGKFNPAQRVVYTLAIIMGAGSVLTGVCIFQPVQTGFLKDLFGGYKGARLCHFLLMLSFLIFIAVHVVQVIRAGWNNFRAMVAGFEIEEE